MDCLGFYLYPVKELGFLLVLGVACGKYRIEGVVFPKKRHHESLHSNNAG